MLWSAFTHLPVMGLATSTAFRILKQCRMVKKEHPVRVAFLDFGFDRFSP